MQSPQHLEHALNLARENNPELRASTQRKLASARSSKAAQELDSPSLSWNATLATQKANSSPRAHNASVGLTLEIPLLDGGSNRSRVSQAVALEQQALAQLDALRLNIELSVRQAASRVSSAAQACEAAEAYLSAANEAAAQAQGRYVSGVGTLPDWLNLQSQQAAARKRLDTALADLALARAELAQATGQLSPNSL